MFNILGSISFKQLELLVLSGSNDLSIVEDDCLILKIPPNLMNNYSECVRQFYNEIYRSYSSKYEGMVLAVDPHFKIYGKYGQSFQDSCSLYLRACVKLGIFHPRIGSTYRVRISRILHKDIIATLYGFILVTIAQKNDNNDSNQQKYSVGDELNVIINNISLSVQDIRLEGIIIGHYDTSENIKTETTEHKKLDSDYSLSNNNNSNNTPNTIPYTRKRKNSN